MIICNIIIDFIMSKSHCVKLFSLLTSSSQAVWLFDTWHIHDNVTIVVNVFNEFNEHIYLLWVNFFYLFLPKVVIQFGII